MRSRIGTSSLAAIGLAAATLTGIALGATSVVSPASAANTYTVADVQAHSTAASCWSIVDGNVYDLTSWIGVHRGGSAVIIGMCGVDASAAFHGMHGSGGNKANTTLAGFKLGVIGTATPTPSPTTTTPAPNPSPTTTTPAPTPSPTTPTTPSVACDDDDDDSSREHDDDDSDHEDGDDHHSAKHDCDDDRLVTIDTRTVVESRTVSETRTVNASRPGRMTIAQFVALTPAAIAAVKADTMEKFKGAALLRTLTPAQIAALNSKQIKALGLNKIKLDDRQKRAFEKAMKHH